MFAFEYCSNAAITLPSEQCDAIEQRVFSASSLINTLVSIDRRIIPGMIVNISPSTAFGIAALISRMKISPFLDRDDLNELTIFSMSSNKLCTVIGLLKTYGENFRMPRKMLIDSN